MSSADEVRGRAGILDHEQFWYSRGIFHCRMGARDEPNVI
jgi:hypothetical protein